MTFTIGQVYELQAGSTQTINPGGTFNGNGSCMDFLTIISTQAGSAAQIEKTTGTVALTYVVLQDIHAIGGATFSAANSADLGNNTGWTFLPVAPRNLYWVGGGGDWNDAVHWSLSSGGAGGECIPTPFDNVFFDQNAGFALAGEQVNINVPVAFCQNMDWTGVLNSPDLTGDYQNKLFIFGSLKFVPDMALAFNGEVHFMAHTTGKTISSAGKEFLGQVSFDGAGGGWILLDAFHANSYLRHRNGALNTNGQDVTVDFYFISNDSPTRALHLGSSNIFIGQGSCYSYFEMSSDPFDFDAGTSTIYMNSTCAESYFYGGSHAYYNLVCDGLTNVIYYNSFHSATFLKSAHILGSNIFESLTFNPGSTYELAAGSTQTITPLGNFIAEGFGGFPIEIKSTQLGAQATLHKDGDPVCLDFLYLTDIAATGTAFTYAGANSDDVFNNSGWLFEACPGCFSAPPLPAPVLDPASVTEVPPGYQATLILQNLPAGYEVVWFNASQTMELYADTANLFQPVVNESTVFYGAFRDTTTGCVSEVLPVVVTAVCAVLITDLVVTPESCPGAGDGSILITAVGTGQQLAYSITGGDWFNLTGEFPFLDAGAYDILVWVLGDPTCSVSAVANVGTAGSVQTWYKDLDDDGYSDGVTQQSCPQPPGFELAANLLGLNNDCNDNDPLQFPGQTWYKDSDNDGYSNGATLVQCSKPVGYKALPQLLGFGDCNDGNANVNPGMSEVCNGVDDNCDGAIDNGAPGGATYVGNVTFTTQAQVNAWAACYSVIQGNLIVQNSGVTSLASLANLVKVTGNVTIKMTALVDMNGLHNLDTIGGGLTINSNTYGSKLQSLNGLEDLDWVGGALKVYYNTSLTNCCAIEHLIGAEPNGVGGVISIYSNASGCNSQSNVLNICPGFGGGNGGNSLAVSTGNGQQPCPDCPIVAQDEAWQIMVFPNPATEALHIEIEGDFEEGFLDLTDLAGRLVQQRQVLEGEMRLVLPLHEVRSGLYFLQLRSGEGAVKTVRVVVAK